MPRILLCEPQEDLATAMQEFFLSESYIVELETNGLRILECLREQQYDLIILEFALHGLDGLGVIRGYRAAKGNTPILLLAGNVSSKEFQTALEAGADAYIAKPFRLADVAAQLRAMLRRPALLSERVLTLGSLTLDTEAGIVTKEGRKIQLFPMEFKLLQFLMKHPNQIFDAQAIFERVWQKEQKITVDTVRTHIRTLRSKIDNRGSHSFIITVRGLGYKTESP